MYRHASDSKAAEAAPVAIGCVRISRHAVRVIGYVSVERRTKRLGAKEPHGRRAADVDLPHHRIVWGNRHDPTAAYIILWGQ
jgi:hypothetical protein